MSDVDTWILNLNKTPGTRWSLLVLQAAYFTETGGTISPNHLGTRLLAHGWTKARTNKQKLWVAPGSAPQAQAPSTDSTETVIAESEISPVYLKALETDPELKQAHDFLVAHTQRKARYLDFLEANGIKE